MFETYTGPVKSPENIAYLRPETAQGIFANFKNVLQTSRVKVPFGIAQIGKSFRNEITPGNFIFRTREFEQMEMEFFVEPGTDEEWHEYWIEERFNWYLNLGLREENLRKREQTDEERAHYATRGVDIEYNFPFGGWSELEGIANRTDYDLKKHPPSGVLRRRTSRTSTRRPARATSPTSSSRQSARTGSSSPSSWTPTPRRRGPRRGAHRPQAPPAHRPGEGRRVPPQQERARLDGRQELYDDLKGDYRCSMTTLAPSAAATGARTRPGRPSA